MRNPAILLLILLTLGCAEREVFAPRDADVLVVDTVLLVGKPFPELWLRRTGSGGAGYSVEEAGENGATVVIRTAGGEIDYTPGNARGLYVANDPGTIVQPATAYVLEIVTARGERLTARTTTPAQVLISEWLLLDETGGSTLRSLRTFADLGDGAFDAPENQLVYSEGLLEARFQGAIHPVGYQIAVQSRQPVEFVIDVSGLDEDQLSDFDATGTSPIFSGEDRSFRLPWFAIYYSGRHVIRIYAVDDNWRSLVTSVPEIYDNGGNFGGNLGDGIDRPDFAVEGGIGLFGSASVDSIGFTILPQP